LHYLQTLSVYGCDLLTDACIKALIEHCKGLKSIDITGCDQKLIHACTQLLSTAVEIIKEDVDDNVAVEVVVD